MREKKVMKLASRGKRFGAFCIDAVVPAVASVILFGVMIAEMIRAFSYYQGFGYPGYGYGYGYGYGNGPSGGAVAAMIISFLLLIAYIVVQLIFFNKSKTIGKAALGLQVISSRDGTPIGFWKMLFRELFVKSASGSVFLLGFIWILIDDKNRGWHDKILDTYVVDVKESEALAAAERRPAQRPAAAQAAYRTPAPKSAPIPVTVPEKTEPAVLADRQAEFMESVIEAADTVAAAANTAAENAVQHTESPASADAADDDHDKVNAVTAETDEERPEVIELSGTTQITEETEKDEEQ